MSIPESGMLETVDAVIDALGGTTAVAALTGRSLQAVSNARARGVLPPEWFFVMGEALRALGLEAPPALWGMVQVPDAAEARP